MAGLVLHRLRTYVRPFVPNRLRPFATRIVGRVVARALAGDVVSCPCCGVRLKRFIVYPSLYCPRCGSYERHRLLTLHLERRPDLLSPPLALLQVSPDRPLDPLLTRSGIARTSIDIDNPTVDLQMDVQQLAFDDDSFDAVVALHVLSEVDDQPQALSELARVLRPGGVAIYQVPVSEQHRLEDNLARLGIEPEVVRAADLGSEACRTFALSAAENTYVCRDPIR